MSDIGRMNEQTALVTGASRGIGKAIALSLAREGARVLCVATSLSGLAATMAALGELGKTPLNGQAYAFAADISDEQSVKDLIAAISETGQTVQILINNAGITKDNLLIRMSEAEFDRVLAVNLRGPFLLCKALARPMMKARYGRIINVSSIVGLMGNAGQANYAASKAGLIGFTKSLARELAGRAVTANIVAPGIIETDMTKDIPEANRKEILRNVPVGRFGSVEEVAAAVGFLASPQAAYITGQVIVVDGGMRM